MVPLAVLEHGPGPVDQHLLAGRAGRVDGPAARDELQQEHAEAVDVGLDAEVARPDVLGRAVAVGAHDARRALAGAELGQPEVGELRAEGVVEEDVGGLEVPVDDGRVGRLVEVLQPTGRAQGHPHPRLPAQPRLGCRCCVVVVEEEEVVGEGAEGHVLVDEEPLLAVGAVADEAHQVVVVEEAQHQNLHDELPVALHAVEVQLLHGHKLPVGEPATVHAPEAALAEEAVGAEVGRGGRELGVREGTGAAAGDVARPPCAAGA